MVSQVGAAKDAAGWIYEFTLTAGPGHSVALAGSFNDWDPDTAPMKDAEWILDEENPNFAPNDFGTLNSVLSVG